jgi:hypothetical protein
MSMKKRVTGGCVTVTGPSLQICSAKRECQPETLRNEPCRANGLTSAESTRLNLYFDGTNYKVVI